MNKHDWQTTAYHAIVRFARQATKPFTIEQARERIRIEPPADLRWWGAVTKHAKREGVLRETGWAPARASHYSPKRVYRGCDGD